MLLEDPEGDTDLVEVGLGVWLVAHLWSIVDAPWSAYQINRRISPPGPAASLDPVVQPHQAGIRITLRF